MFTLYDAVAGCTFMAIPDIIGSLVKLAYLAIRIIIPIVLLIVGMIDLGKAIIAQKEDEIKKSQGLLIKRIIAAVLVFLLFTLIQWAINLVDRGNANNASMWSCVNALLGSPTNTECPPGYGNYDANTGFCKEQ